MLIKETPVALTEELWMLGTAAYPLFLFTGEQEAVIFEGGTGAMGPLLREQMETLNLDPSLVKQAVVTHAHPDHVMAVPLFRELFPGVEVLASEAAAGTLSVEKAISFFCQIDEALNDALIKAGTISQRHRPQPLAEMQIAVDRLIKEGDAITVDGAAFNVLEMPGHSDCSLSFHEPQRGILLVADATGYYVPEHHYWWPNYFTGYDVYLDSMRRLAGLEAEILCLGHNAVVKGAKDIETYFRDAISATEAYHRRIVDEANAGKPTRQIAEELGSEIYEKSPLLPEDFFQKNCGLMVKQSLRHEGISVEKK